MCTYELCMQSRVWISCQLNIFYTLTFIKAGCFYKILFKKAEGNMLHNYKTNMWSSQKQAPDAIQMLSTIPSVLHHYLGFLWMLEVAFQQHLDYHQWPKLDSPLLVNFCKFTKILIL